MPVDTDIESSVFEGSLGVGNVGGRSDFREVLIGPTKPKTMYVLCIYIVQHPKSLLLSH